MNRRRTSDPLTHQRLLEALHYDPETGHFYWLAPLGRAVSGQRAGYRERKKCSVYVRTSIDGVRYYAHQLAWFYVYKVWPVQIDHRDMDGENNRISNLRECSDTENLANRRPYKNNKVGLKGVVCVRGRYYAQINRGGKRKHLGTFDTAEGAHSAYADAAVQVYGEFARVA